MPSVTWFACFRFYLKVGIIFMIPQNFSNEDSPFPISRNATIVCVLILKGFLPRPPLFRIPSLSIFLENVEEWNIHSCCRKPQNQCSTQTFLLDRILLIHFRNTYLGISKSVITSFNMEKFIIKLKLLFSISTSISFLSRLGFFLQKQNVEAGEHQIQPGYLWMKNFEVWYTCYPWTFVFYQSMLPLIAAFFLNHPSCFNLYSNNKMY